jgi:hypothetical protein
VNRLLRIGLFAGLLALSPVVASAQQIAAAPDQQAAAKQVVEKFQDQLLVTMKNADAPRRKASQADARRGSDLRP